MEDGMDAMLRYAVIGVGLMGQEHCANLLALRKLGYAIEVVALADPHEPSSRAALHVVGSQWAPRVYTDFKQMLQTEQELDVVIVATPNFHHVHVLRYLLPQFPRLHVLCEKPMATTLDDCREIVQLCSARPGVFWIGLEYRYMPPIARLIELARAGTVGTVRQVAIREHRFPFLVKVNDWNRFSRNTGGTLVEKCCHFFDLMNEIAQDAPLSVYASGAQDVNHLDERYNGETPDILDNAFVVVNYSRGLRAMLDLCMFAEASQNQEEVCVVGDLGKLEAFLPSHELRTGLRGNHALSAVEVVHVRERAVTYAGHHYGSSQLEHMDLYQVIQTKQPARVGPHNGLLSVAMGIAAHLSITQQRVVRMAELL
ncbi:UDP-N-acetylglucosamine 3-dehydrogenase [Porphyridium purpureum]|uniref:UDP-N-acetylglucosamine 3-dehydrogenase n=1 Tax=Porphyridium purpureum TaxID=35688 RepID=A0A5J4YS60_PORPP|nr:UDP-N-acetylglucosamine 3-dehydrogenase [Porphyridium purpureum]|eukprot:POR9623..scf229_5